MAERPDKYRYSRLWLSEDQVVGMVVASQKGGTVRIHRIALARSDELVPWPVITFGPIKERWIFNWRRDSPQPAISRTRTTDWNMSGSRQLARASLGRDRTGESRPPSTQPHNQASPARNNCRWKSSNLLHNGYHGAPCYQPHTASIIAIVWKKPWAWSSLCLDEGIGRWRNEGGENHTDAP